MKKIAIVANSTWNIYNFRFPLIQLFQREDYQIIIIAPLDKYFGLFSKSDFSKFIPLKHLSPQSKNPFNDLFLLRELFKIYQKERPDLILHYTIKPNIFGSIAARWLGIPCISTVTGLGYTFLNESFYTALVKPLYKFAFRNNSKVIFHNHDDQALFINLGLVKKNFSEVIKGSGVNTNFFKPVKKEPSEKFIFLFIGRLLFDKGIIEFMQAAQTAREKNKKIECWIVGELKAKNPSNIPEEELKKYISNEDIRYLGVAKDVRGFIKDADVVVLPSYREGMPRAVLEGMAMRKPIITTMTSGCREAVDEEVNGYLVPIRDSISLAKAMVKMSNLEEYEIDKMGIESRKKVLNEFDEKIINQQYLILVENLI